MEGRREWREGGKGRVGGGGREGKREEVREVETV